ncbi:M14 family metallopeptidase [Fervidibacillus halotolerans]|uniref:M14 family metallopeptidase n=1 Tax=Fervidibacillus halotolerans TaxID=2980027 RepID=A0A9E8LYR0_9BACI|nr:M14 family metallopeptidase [Fervidibacillus halotolerans]WAA11456.1 M14 family metallopeptidase [Fervidibacillus halotolerans]
MKVRVRKGDTFWLYSNLFQVPLPLIEDANPNIEPTTLQIGEEVKIPGYITNKKKIQKGDTLWKLARELNLPVYGLILLNPQVNPNQLMINETVYLPKRVTGPIVQDVENYSFEKMVDHINRLQEIYPFIRLNDIGKTVLGKPIYEIDIGRGDRAVHFNGSFHANEWITTPVLMRLINEYALSLVNGNPIRGIYSLPLYNRNRVSVVPMVNPDGVNLVLKGPPEKMKEEVIAINGGSLDFSSWKANIRGVDLNNQYPANWEIEKERKEPKKPAPRDYPGDAPLTEPEAQTMANLANERQFSRMLAFHTQGKEFYWGYENFEPEESERLANEFARVSGYESIRYVDSHAGYKDWFIQTYRKPGFTFELGKGVNPISISQFPTIYEEMLGVFLLSLYL